MAKHYFNSLALLAVYTQLPSVKEKYTLNGAFHSEQRFTSRYC